MKYYKDTMRILHFLFGFVIFCMASLALNFALVQRTKFTTGSSFELDSIVPLQQDPLQITDPITSKSKLNKRTKRLVDRYDTDMKKERETGLIMEAIRNYNKMRQADKETAGKSAINKVDSPPVVNQIPFNNGIKFTQKMINSITFWMQVDSTQMRIHQIKHNCSD